jgi:hypothetical protein
MDRKYLIPLLIGLGVIILALIAGALFFNGSPELGTGAALAAAAAAEAGRRNHSRSRAREELDEAARKAEVSKERLGDLKDDYEEERKKNDEVVKNTPLADLVDEENDRRA